MNLVDLEQVHHVARLAFLSMSVRAVAAAEFEGNPEVDSVRVLVSRSDSEPQASIDLEFLGSGGFPLGGMSL